jgi:hypothetical protein
MLSALVGFVVCVVSLWSIVAWWADVSVVLRGLLPLGFLFGGVVALIAGLSAAKPTVRSAQPNSAAKAPVKGS